MDATTTRPRAAPPQATPARRRRPPRIAWNAVSIWLLGFGLVAYLGLEGGGYDPLVHDQVGIAAWWVLLAAVAVGALPRRRLPRPAWAALGLLAAFVAWTALSLGWTESVERTWADLARVAGYLGVFALALFVRGPRGARRMVAAIGSAVALVAGVALLSRLHPTWFPEAGQTARFLPTDRERLSYPLDYWNALAALIAIGLPLLLHLATGARSVALRGLSAAALPVLALTSFLTLSRGGMAAAVLALAVFLTLAPNRLPKLATLAVAAVGSAPLIAAAAGRDALQHGLSGAAAHHQGTEVLLMTLGVCAAVGFAAAGIALAEARGRRPRWTEVPPHRARLAAGIGLVVLLAAAIALGAPGRASNAWSDFKQQGGPGNGTGRLDSASGNGRYAYWRGAVEENASRPLTGTGSGTFQLWWQRNGDIGGAVHDAHSLYMQTLGELGIVGLALLAAFLAAILVGGLRATLRAGPRGRPQLAAALAGCAAFCVVAAFDWVWQIPVLPVAVLLLAAVLVSAAPTRPEQAGRGLPWIPARAALLPASAVAIVAIAIPLASTGALRRSQADARAGNLTEALAEARSARNAEPAAAAPRLQEALVLEQGGELGPAASAAAAATERERSDWRTWLVRYRIEAERGRADAALRYYRRAKSLNPRSGLFTR